MTKGYKFCKRCYGKGYRLTNIIKTGGGFFFEITGAADRRDYRSDIEKIPCYCTDWTWWEVVLHFIKSKL